MYNQFTFLYPLLCVLLIQASACSTETQNVVAYHQTIQTEIQQVREDYLLFSESLGSRDKTAIQSRVKQLKSNLDKSMQQLQDLPTLSNDFEYKAIAIKQLQVLRNNLDTRYPKIIDLTTIGDLTEQQAEQLEVIYEEIEDLEEPLYEQCERASTQFCKHYKIEQ